MRSGKVTLFHPMVVLLVNLTRCLTGLLQGSWLVVTDWIKKYGPVFGYYRGGPARILMVADHEMLKTILIKDFAHFSDRTVRVAIN